MAFSVHDGSGSLYLKEIADMKPPRKRTSSAVLLTKGDSPERGARSELGSWAMHAGDGIACTIEGVGGFGGAESSGGLDQAAASGAEAEVENDGTPPLASGARIGDSTASEWSLVGGLKGLGVAIDALLAPPPSNREASQLISTTNAFDALNTLDGQEYVSVGDAAMAKGQSRRRRVRAGDMAAHARFLQYYFRRSRAMRPGCWRQGGLRGLVLYRPATTFGCRSGLNLAPRSAIAAQRERAGEVLRWYSNYVRLHRRLHRGRVPTALVTFCGEGGVSEGVHRAGGAAHGQDRRAMPRYEARFGKGHLSSGDSRNPQELRRLKRASGAFVTLASPPCKAHSAALMRGAPSEPKMIRETRAALREVGGLYAIENVVGAASELEGSRLLRGAYFGLNVDRPRLFECNFDLHVDRALKVGGDALRGGMCLGERRRWRRLDPFGRPDACACCSGNLWAVQGDKPFRCTPAECSAAMGLDDGHMSYEGMTQAVPPVYAELLFAQACMRDLEREFSLRPILFDEHEAAPEETRRRMAHLLQGAGAAAPSQGVELERALPAARGQGLVASQMHRHAGSD